MIDILIPTYHRPDRIAKVAKNVEKTTTTKYDLHFLIDDDDKESIAAAKKAKVNYFAHTPKRWGQWINWAYEHTTGDFLLLGADDIEFTKGWDKLMLKEMDNPKIGVVGAWDNWPITQSGKHGSHPLLRRKYIEEQGGHEDAPGKVFNPVYFHYNTDIELEQTAHKRGAFAMSKAKINHHHFVNEEAEMDATYLHGQEKKDHDYEMYELRRKNFEFYLTEEFNQGRLLKVDRTPISIVMASYNAPDAIEQTVSSLIENTYSDFELIIIDDNSSDPRTINFLKNLKRQDTTVTFATDHRLYTNAAWNAGVKQATHDYIAVVNNDVLFSKNWDQYLKAAFTKDVWITNPYQTDEAIRIPYGSDPRAGCIDLRGICYMLTREAVQSLFPIPEELKMWCGDNYLAWKMKKSKKKSVFVPGAIVHNLGSVSSRELHRRTGTFIDIIEKDSIAYHKLTKENVDFQLNAIKQMRGIPRPIVINDPTTMRFSQTVFVQVNGHAFAGKELLVPAAYRDTVKQIVKQAYGIEPL